MADFPLIACAGVCKAFNGRSVLNGVDLTVNQGESVVIIGLSGSGKSVLLKHLIGFLAPDCGQVTISGQDWQRLNDDQRLKLRQRFGMVFQDAALFDDLTIEENVALPLDIRDDLALSATAIRERVSSLLNEVGLASEARRRPVELSGGMRKRAGIARALAITPSILLYDEPTAGLDRATAERISRVMRDAHQRHLEVTSITVTHDYACAALIADRILCLDNKRGTLRELTADIQQARASASDEDEARRLTKAWLEHYFEQADIARNVTTPVESSSSPFRALAHDLAHGFNILGQLFFLLFEMGFPLRKRDLLTRCLSLGIHSFPMIVVAGLFIGMIGMVQFYSGVGDLRDVLPTPIPAVLTTGVFKVLAPLLVGILLAGGVGSNISADIGAKTLLQQIEALESLAISPKRLLLSPMVFALALTVPLMSLLAAIAGMIGGYLIWLSFGESGSYYWAVASTRLTLPDLFYVLAKSAAIGVLIGLVSYQQGTEPKHSSEDIANATTRTVLLASLLVVIFDFLVSYVYTRYL